MSKLHYDETLAFLRESLTWQLRVDQRDPAAVYRITPTNEVAVRKVAAWLARQPLEGIDTRKSLLLAGNTGTGKTLLMRAASRFIIEVWGLESFGVVSCRTLARSYAESGYGEEVDRWMNAPHICLDDLGAENPEQVRYGQRTNLMAEFLEHRYDMLKRGRRAWTHITTNLDLPRLKEVYGSRVMSRIGEMMNLVPCGTTKDAEDFRIRTKGSMPVEAPKVQANVYEAFSPEIATRLLDAIGRKGPRLQDVGRTEFGPSLEADLARLREYAARMSMEDLQEIRRGLGDQKHSAPYVKGIDQAIAAR